MATKPKFEKDESLDIYDYEKRAEEIIKQLDLEVFSRLETEDNVSKRFYANSIGATLQPMQVTTKLNRLLRVYRPMTSEQAKALTDTDYLRAYGYYCDIISHINNYLVYMPDKQTFSAFVNITSNIYNELLADPNYTQVFMSFEDAFVQSNFSASQAGIADKTTTLSKLQTREAGHSLVKTNDYVPQVTNNNIDKQQILINLEKYGNTLKKIERKR